MRVSHVGVRTRQTSEARLLKADRNPPSLDGGWGEPQPFDWTLQQLDEHAPERNGLLNALHIKKHDYRKSLGFEVVGRDEGLEDLNRRLNSVLPASGEKRNDHSAPTCSSDRDLPLG